MTLVHEPVKSDRLGTVNTKIVMITGMFQKCIHAVTAAGFELKVFLFVLAHSFQFTA
ncbi:hypothetical protein CCP3SC5AM1_730004 [Gammaproteobacteria bacterium]